MENEYVDIHGFNEKMRRIKSKIGNEKGMLESNREHILKFATFMEAKGLKFSTIHKDLYALWFIGKNLRKDFKACSRDDIMEVCSKINQQQWTNKTKRNHTVALKKMWKWLYNIEEKGTYPKAVSWLDTSPKDKTHKLPEDLLTEEEVNKMVGVCENIRDKTFISLLYESGARIGEILNLRIKHIVFAEWGGAYLMLNGKTGMRRVTVISSVPLLSTYLDMHPSKDKPEHFFFLVKGGGIIGYRQMTYAGARKMIKEVAVRAGIKKRIHPHLFRHSSATRAAKFLTESQMKEYYGWTGGSDMPCVYVHLSGRDMEDAIKKMHGIKTETQDGVKSTIIACVRCKQKNSPGSKFCNKCGLILDLETALKLDQKQKGANNLLNLAIQEDPGLLQNPQRLAEFIQLEVEKQLAQRPK